MLYAMFGWNWSSGSGEDENVKSYKEDDDDRQRKNSDQKSSHKPLAQVSKKINRMLFYVIFADKWSMNTYKFNPEWHLVLPIDDMTSF